MRHFVDIAILSGLVFAAIWVLACYPESRLGRILFARQGPPPLRGEPRSRYLLRWATYCAGWFAQAVVVFGLGFAAQRLQPALGESLPFVVFWLVVVPLLAAVALAAALLAVVASLWRRCVGRERAAAGASPAVNA